MTKNFDLRPGEAAIDTWTLFYHHPDGGKYNGKLAVTGRRLLYAASDDASFAGVLGSRAAAGYLEIERNEISGIEVRKKLLSKKAFVTLADGTVHIFDYGAMNIDKCVAAMEAC
jgi:hypothetical protein